MKFVFVATNRWTVFGGSEVLWSRAAALLAERGHAVVAAVPAKQMPGPHVAALRAAGARVVEAPPHSPYGRPSVANRLRSKLAGPPLARELSAADFAVVSQAHCYDGVDWAGRLSRERVPYALVSQAASEHLWPSDDRAADAARRAHESAAASYFVSHANLALVRRQLAADLPRGEVAYNPVQTDRDAGPLPWPDDDGLRLASVSRLDCFAKGHDLALEVLARPRWRDRPVTLDLFGGGVHEGMIRRQIDRLGLSNVRLAGRTDDVAGVWRDHHALLLCSRFEGLPLALAEAALLGRPAVVTDVAGNGEIVEEGVTGFLAAAPTADLADAALGRAWDRRGDLRGLGLAAADRARAVLPPDPVGAFADRLERVAGEGCRPRRA